MGCPYMCELFADSDSRCDECLTPSDGAPVVIYDDNRKSIKVTTITQQTDDIDTVPHPCVGSEVDTKPMRASATAALRIESLLIGIGFGESE